MARRVSATRKARRENMMSAEAEAKKNINRSFEMIAQDLKVIDIKRQVIKSGKKNLPFAYIGLAIASLFLLVTILAISIIGMVIAGSLFSGALAQVTGPMGIPARRKSSIDEIDKAVDRIIHALPKLPDGETVSVFGVRKVSKAGVNLSQPPTRLTRDVLDQINDDGVFAFEAYKFLGVAKQLPSGAVDLSFRDLRAHRWYMEALNAGLKDEAILAALSPAT